MKKTAAIRRAREAVPPPVSWLPPKFIVRMPSDVRQPDSERVDMPAKDYLEAQHIRSFAIARIALALMGLGHVPLSMADGGSIDQLMDKALDRSAHGWDDAAPLPFWQVRLARTPADERAAFNEAERA